MSIAFAGARGRTILDAAPLVYLGDISYSTYLAHFFLLVMVKNFQTAGAHMTPAWLMAYFVTVAVASVLLYRLVEIPAQRIILERMGLIPRRADVLCSALTSTLTSIHMYGRQLHTIYRLRWLPV